MQAPLLHKICDQTLWLSPQRAIFWEEQKALILSDLHFGKTGHFRKWGIAVPQSVYKEDLQRLVMLLQYFKPQQMIVVGDFFHSRANTELDWFQKWRADFANVAITLVKGNHDILQDSWYRETAINVVDNSLSIGPFHFMHEACGEMDGQYTFCGHIHPGVVLYGAGKQSLRFPCFYFSGNHCILPAFSRFTGTVAMDTGKADAIFAVVENTLIKL